MVYIFEMASGEEYPGDECEYRAPTASPVAPPVQEDNVAAPRLALAETAPRQPVNRFPAGMDLAAMIRKLQD